MKIAITLITDRGMASAEILKKNFDSAEIFDLRGKGRLREWAAENFHRYEGHIFIMSTGIVYRIIAPLITDKYNDPAVVTVDDARRFAIAALSGHEGGANRLAFKTARILDAQPVVTTASDSNKQVIMGIGCRKGATADEISEAVNKALEENGLEKKEIRMAASADIKKEEKGMVDAFDRMDIPLIFIPSEKIRTFTGYKSVSSAAQRQLGLPGVSEPCALMAGGRSCSLIQERKAYGAVTIALAREIDL